MVMDRLQGTGVITREVATDLGHVGIAARCAGVDVDTRGIIPTQHMVRSAPMFVTTRH